MQIVAEKHSINTVYLFGSYADGSYDENSDIDLAFVGLTEGIDYGRLYFDLQEMYDKQIDLIDLRKAPLVSAFNIIKDGVVVYSANEEKRTDFEDDTVREYLDFLVFHRLALAEVRSRFQLEGIVP